MITHNDIKKRYEYLCERESDINQHLPTFYEYGTRVDHITEFGVRSGLSTIAFLHSNPKQLVSYDINPYSLITSDQCPNFKFIQTDVLNVEIEETDLLFIDTYHSYWQLTAELKLHANQVRRYIVVHDTETFGYIGEDRQSPGVSQAIEDFVLRRPEWRVVGVWTNNNGLTILKRGQHEKSKSKD